jgi:large subunit ribosomal protein L24
MNKIKKGDTVIVISGRDSSPAKRGVVKQVYTDGKLLVEGVNLVKKHQKPNPMKNQTGGIIDKEMPLHISNVMLLNPATGKGDRVGFKFLEAQGGNAARKVRFFKSNGEVVDV